MTINIKLGCKQCYLHNNEEVIIETYVNDDGFYQVTCKNRHLITAITSHPKFESLFEIGFYNLLNNQPSEAVFSFSRALERFYEFFIHLILYKKETPFYKIKEFWKLIENQSERQLGAFISLYLNENKCMPPLLNNQDISFRNKVIHKGKIPKIEQAINFGEKIYHQIYSIMKPYFLKIGIELINSFLIENLFLNFGDIINCKNTGFLDLGGVMNISKIQMYNESKTLTDIMEKYKNNKDEYVVANLKEGFNICMLRFSGLERDKYHLTIKYGKIALRYDVTEHYSIS